MSGIKTAKSGGMQSSTSWSDTPNWIGLGILSASLVAGVLMRSTLSPVQEAARQDLRLSDLQMSFVQGLAVAIPMVIFSIPLGRLVDRVHRVRLIFAMGLIAVAGTAIAAFANAFWVLFGARLMVGLGSVCMLPAAISLAADLAHARFRGRLLSILSLGTPVGTALAFVIAELSIKVLTAHAGLDRLGNVQWRWVHIISAAMSLIAITLLLALREPSRQGMGSVSTPTFKTAAAALWRLRPFLIPLMIGQNAAVMADTAASIWAAPVLGRAFGLEPKAFAGWMGAVILGSGVVGVVAGGLLADFGQRNSWRGGVLLGATCAAALTVPAACFACFPRIYEFAAGLAVLLTCGAVTSVATSTAVTLFVPNALRGFCLSLFVVAGGVLGFGVAPTLVPVVGDLIGGPEKLGSALALCSASICGLSFLGFLVAIRFAPMHADSIDAHVRE